MVARDGDGRIAIENQDGVFLARSSCGASAEHDRSRGPLQICPRRHHLVVSSIGFNRLEQAIARLNEGSKGQAGAGTDARTLIITREHRMIYRPSQLFADLVNEGIGGTTVSRRTLSNRWFDWLTTTTTTATTTATITIPTAISPADGNVKAKGRIKHHYLLVVVIIGIGASFGIQNVSQVIGRTPKSIQERNQVSLLIQAMGGASSFYLSHLSQRLIHHLLLGLTPISFR